MFQVFLDGILIITTDSFTPGFKLAMFKDVDWLSYILNMLGYMALAFGCEYYMYSW